MGGYAAEIGSIRSAAEAARSAGEQAAAVDLAQAIADAGTALPGARAVRSFGTLGNAWRGDIAGWSAQAQGYAENLAGAADRYAASEASARSDFADRHDRPGSP